MDKPGIFIAAIFAIAINCVACQISAEERAHTEAFLTRLSNARAASTGERLVEGEVTALLAAPVTTPYYNQPVAAYAAWINVGKGAKHLTDSKDLKLVNAGFVVKTASGDLPVGGRAVGVSDLLYQEYNRSDQGIETKIEVHIAVGDHVTVLGQVTTRDGVAGFWGDVIIVKGTYEKWHKDAATKSPISIPEQGYIQP